MIQLDYGLTLAQFAVLNAVWAASIVLLEVPSGALADRFGRKRMVVIAAMLMVIEMVLIQGRRMLEMSGIMNCAGAEIPGCVREEPR